MIFRLALFVITLFILQVNTDCYAKFQDTTVDATTEEKPDDKAADEKASVESSVLKLKVFINLNEKTESKEAVEKAFFEHRPKLSGKVEFEWIEKQGVHETVDAVIQNYGQWHSKMPNPYFLFFGGRLASGPKDEFLKSDPFSIQVVYKKEGCKQCKAARALFREIDSQYSAISIEEIDHRSPGSEEATRKLSLIMDRLGNPEKYELPIVRIGNISLQGSIDENRVRQIIQRGY